jgi:hypothetical protein
MKIGRIETFILGTGSSKDLLFDRIEPKDGLHGWGEAYVPPRARRRSSPNASRRWRRTSSAAPTTSAIPVRL